MNETYLDTAIKAARAASRIHQYYITEDLDIDTKSSHIDLVTKVDKLSEAKIREILLTAYPDHTVLGEEEGQKSEASHRWIVDPLDGTLNYAHGFPFYCVSIALEINNTIELGVVYDGIRNELFTAVKGQGAFLNGQRINPSEQTDLSKTMIATGFSYDETKLKENLDIFARVHLNVRGIRRAGGAALDLCYVASGRLDGYWELTLGPWDVAAGMIIVQEAGGTVTGGQGQPYQVTNPFVVATNGHIHSKLLNQLEQGEPQDSGPTLV